MSHVDCCLISTLRSLVSVYTIEYVFLLLMCTKDKEQRYLQCWTCWLYNAHIWRFLKIQNGWTPIQMLRVNSETNMNFIIWIWRFQIFLQSYIFLKFFFTSSIFLARFFALYNTYLTKSSQDLAFFQMRNLLQFQKTFFGFSDEVKFSNYKNVEK